MPREDHGAVEQEEDEEGRGRGQDHRHLRVLVVVGRSVESHHWNDAQLKKKLKQSDFAISI